MRLERGKFLGSFEKKGQEEEGLQRRDCYRFGLTVKRSSRYSPGEAVSDLELRQETDRIEEYVKVALSKLGYGSGDVEVVYQGVKWTD